MIYNILRITSMYIGFFYAFIQSAIEEMLWK